MTFRFISSITFRLTLLFALYNSIYTAVFLLSRDLSLLDYTELYLSNNSMNEFVRNHLSLRYRTLFVLGLAGVEIN